jgi:hypothetical protein
VVESVYLLLREPVDRIDGAVECGGCGRVWGEFAIRGNAGVQRDRYGVQLSAR